MSPRRFESDEPILRQFEAVRSEVHALHMDRAHWRRLLHLAENNPKIPSPNHVLAFVARLYISHAVTGVRRQVERRTDVVNFVGLLDLIIKHQHLFNRSRCLRYWRAEEPIDVAAANCFFDGWAEAGADTVSPLAVGRDIDALLALTARVTDFATKLVVHRDREFAYFEGVQPFELPNWNDLDQAIDVLGQKLIKYNLFLQGGSLVSAEPKFQGYWESALTVPWLSMSKYDAEDPDAS